MAMQRSDDENAVLERIRRVVDTDPGDWGAMYVLAVTLRDSFERGGDGNALDEAVDLAGQAASVMASDHPDLPAVLAFLAAVLRTRFEWSSNIDDLTEAVSMARRALAVTTSGDPLRPAVMSNLAASLSARSEHTGEQGDLDESIAVIRKVLAGLPLTAEDRPAVLSNLAAALRARFERAGSDHDLDEAVDAALEALASVAPGHPMRPAALSTLARVLHLKGELDQAEAGFRAVLDARRETLGPEHPDTLASRHLLGVVLRDQGRAADSEDELRNVVEVRRRVLGADHPDTLASRHMLAVTLRDQGLFAKAAAGFRTVLYEARRILGADHPDTRATQQLLQAVDAEVGSPTYESHQRLDVADRDPLTGVLHRVAFVRRGQAMLRALGGEALAGLLLLNLNRFREVNDALGYPSGDTVLRAVASRLDAVVQPDELLARIGGDQFALLLTAVPPAPTETDPTESAYVMGRARVAADAVARPIGVDDLTISVDASIGIAIAENGGASLNDLLRRADVALFHAKRTGRETMTWGEDTGEDAARLKKFVTVNELRQAMTAPERIELALQPVISLDTGNPVAVEVLAKWRDARHTYPSTAELMQALEGSDLAGLFTRHVVDAALGQSSDWVRAGMALPTSVNIPSRALTDPQLPADLAALLRRYRIPADRLVLEISETAPLLDEGGLGRVIAELRRHGFQLSLDDFGTGHTSLGLLARLNVNEVKIAASFVREMSSSPPDASIVRAIIELARTLELRVVAQGVETADQREALAQLNCPAAQGGYLCPPLPPSEFLAFLNQTATARTVPEVAQQRPTGRAPMIP